MRVFFVRPSDNGNYGVEPALASLASPPEELHVALFRGYRVPLEPLNFDPRRDGLASLGRYDLVVLAGLDPVVLSPAEQLGLVAFVERGGGLLLLGGSHSFGNAEGTYALLDPILPVRVLRGLDVEANVMPSGSSHPIARGLPTPLGYVGKVHPVEPKPGASVAMRAGEMPLVVAGEHGYGRAVVLASFPECEESEYGWFFTGDAFDDFLRSVVAWLRKDREPVWFESFSLPNRQVLVGNEEFGRAKLGSAQPVEVRLRTRLIDAKGKVVFENVASHAARGAREADVIFSFRVPDEPRARGLHYVAVALADAAGREIARRDVAVEVLNPTRVAVRLEHGRRVLLPGQAVQMRLLVTSSLKEPPQEVAVDVMLADDGGRPVAAPRRRLVRRAGGAYEDLSVSFPVPAVRPGRYRLRVEARVGEELADLAEEELLVVAGAGARAARFPLIAEGGYHLDAGSTERAVEELARVGATALSLPSAPATGFDEMPHRAAMLAYAEERAAVAGLTVVLQRRPLVPGLSHNAPLVPCALTPEFRHTLERAVRPLLAAAARVPNLGFCEMMARAAVLPQQLCRCQACQAAYKRSLGTEMPQGPLASLASPQLRALAAFVTSYWWHVFSAIRKLRDEVAGGVRLSLGFDASSFLRDGPDAPYSDPLVWARAADSAEVAPEPDLARYRLSLAGHQALMAALGKPCGAQVDIGPDALPPPEAAYTALARGAAYLRAGDNPRFLFFRQQAPIGEALCGAFARLAPAGPLLAASTRPPSRVALLFPFTEVAAAGNRLLLPAFEFLWAAVGEVDLLHERLATEGGLAPYAVVALLGARVMPRRVAAALAHFVERGGLLLADSAELRDEDGKPLAWPEGFFGEAETPVFGEVAVRRRRFGAGRTLLLSGHIVRAHQEAVERGDLVAQRELRRALADAVAEHGVRPWARASDPNVEVGIRLCADAWLLVAANHSDDARTTRVELDPAAVPAVCAYDLMTWDSAPMDTSSGVLALTVRLRPRDGGLWVLYPERPFTLRLEAPEASGLRDGRLQYRVMVINEAGRPARGCHIVRVRVTDPAGEDRPELGGERLTKGGVLDVAESFAVNERQGRWTIAVTDPLTRRVVRRAVEVSGASGGVPEPMPPQDASP